MKFFTNENQLLEWIDASEAIKESFGINKALGCLIEEKFYNIIHLIFSYRKINKSIEEQREKPDYNPIDEYEAEGFKFVTKLDEDYEQLIDHPKAARENKTIEFMVKIYCNGQHGTKTKLCPQCDQLLKYARQRIKSCILKEDKPYVPNVQCIVINLV